MGRRSSSPLTEGEPVKGKTRRIDYWQDPNAPAPTSRKASASAFVLDDSGRLLLLQRVDNGLWTIPTGGVKKGETVAQAAVRECREETGLGIEVTGLVGVFSDPGHVIAYLHGDRVDEVRQPINVCLRARVVGGAMSPDPKEAAAVRWVSPAELDGYRIHPALRVRIEHGLHSPEPHID
ncbi:NUDIX domain-containing protein [Streptomyces gamaensis]|uniref:NUDIX domain-containing protein n=1 Tax=Streptomyces gamaensis TaxID=1763542 RepID=A0ABW0YXZ8_9ACTN